MSYTYQVMILQRYRVSVRYILHQMPNAQSKCVTEQLQRSQRIHCSFNLLLNVRTHDVNRLNVNQKKKQLKIEKFIAAGTGRATNSLELHANQKTISILCILF